MGTGSMKNISMKQTNKNVDDDGTGVKPKHFLLRGIRYKSRCDQIQQMWDRDRKIAIFFSIYLFIFPGKNFMRLKFI